MSADSSLYLVDRIRGGVRGEIYPQKKRGQVPKDRMNRITMFDCRKVDLTGCLRMRQAK